MSAPVIDGSTTAGHYRTVPIAAIAAGPTGDVVIAYSVSETLAGTATARVHYTRLGLLPPGATCGGADGCADGFCAAGFCCDTPCDPISIDGRRKNCSLQPMTLP